MSAEHTAELRVVASSIQVLAREHRYERWAGFPAERTRLVELLGRSDNELRIGEQVCDANFGSVEIDWARGVARLSLVDELGRARVEGRVPLRA